LAPTEREESTGGPRALTITTRPSQCGASRQSQQGRPSKDRRHSVRDNLQSNVQTGARGQEGDTLASRTNPQHPQSKYFNFIEN